MPKSKSCACNQMRAYSRINQSGVPGPEGSIQKIFWSELNQRFQQIAQEILGPYGQLTKGAPGAFDDGSGRTITCAPAAIPSRPAPRRSSVSSSAISSSGCLRVTDMQFGLTETQQVLKNSARKFFPAECPIAEVRRLMETDTAFDAALWKKIADQGWCGIIFPEEYDGLGLGMVELTAAMEEDGCALVPGPFFSTVAAER